MLNNCTFMGRLTRDPEIRYTKSQLPVASFSIAVDRDYSGKDGGEKQTDFFNCVAWRSTAEFISRYFKKGSMICVNGRMQTKEWENRDGEKRTGVELQVNSVYFAESKRDSNASAAPAAPVPAASDCTDDEAFNYDDLDGLDDFDPLP